MVRVVAALLLLQRGALATCGDEDACQAQLASLIGGLSKTDEGMNTRYRTLKALEDLRGGVLEGRRVDLPSAQRRHLEQGAPFVSSISYDARHKPVSTNVDKHFVALRTLGSGTKIRMHAFMPLKQSSSGKDAPSALLLALTEDSLLSVYSLEGEALLEGFDLGHGPGRSVTHVSPSPSSDDRFVVSGDDAGNIRVHSLKVAGKKSEAGAQLVVSATFAGAVALCGAEAGRGALGASSARGDEACRLTALLPLDRGAQPSIFVAGDAGGGISVFHRNGTAKGRVLVTEDHGGVSGLLRGQGQTLLFHSAHSFGAFSVAQMDVQYPPCNGWNSPLVDVAVDPVTTRVVLALADGDVLVYTSARGSSKHRACELLLKFPHSVTAPFSLHAFKGFILGLPQAPKEVEVPRDLFFFSMRAMESGYGVTPQRALVLQASFKARALESLALHSPPAGKSLAALRYAGATGVELYEVSIKATAAKAGDGGVGDLSAWIEWFPKIGVFGLALVGVVVWNVRKVSGPSGSQDKSDDFDDGYLKEMIDQRKLEKQLGGLGAQGAGSGASGAGLNAGGSDFNLGLAGGRDMDD